jgi:NhaA family Na+:H+ antiporter
VTDTPPLDPTPLDPTPLDPTPLDPTPLDPTPLDPTPLDPTPLDPTPLDPTPLDSTPLAAAGTGSRPVFARGSYGESRRITEILRKESVGGALLLVAAVAALVWANSPASGAYYAVRDFTVGYEPWHLDLSIGHWASDGLLAIFFFIVGLELKREFIAGDLRDPRTAVVPVLAAVGGVAVPALIYTLVNASDTETVRGWAIPTATDIAFAVAVLAIIGSKLPSALRIFLLTLAVVDDFIAIGIIAVAFTRDIDLVALGLAVLPIALFGFLVQRFRRFFGGRVWTGWVILVPIAFVAWALVHASGVHATIAGVALAFTVPVVRSAASGGPDAGPGLAEVLEHRIRPLSAGFAVPVFAFFAAGVTVVGDELGAALTDTVTIGVVVGLVAGKMIGIAGTTWLVTTLTKATLDPAVKWIDLVGISLLAGIGFTVSLLVAGLTFGEGSPHDDHAKVGILLASLIAAGLASTVLAPRNRHYARIAAEETEDADADGIPDVYQSAPGAEGPPTHRG